MRISDWSSDVCSSDLVVGQRLLGQALAVVEGAGDAERAYVVAPAAEAVSLARRDLAVRIEDDDLESRAAMERGRDRRARIAGGCDEDGDGLCSLGTRLRHGFGEKPSSEVIESRGRAWDHVETRVAVSQRQDAVTGRSDEDT